MVAGLALAAALTAAVPPPGGALPLVPQPQEIGDPDEAPGGPLPPEGYFLRIDRSGGVTVRAADAAGRFYAEQTLRQLRAAFPDGALPALSIRDWPAFPWRGVHLDESRHFFGKETVKRTLETMSRFKLNVFHWHLIDDSGWRLEIPGHPELTRAGATRTAKKGYRWLKDTFDGAYGPFAYSAADVREILAFAAARHIRVVPEVELPGHSAHILKTCCPQFACDPRKPGGVFCLGNEAGMKFLEDVVSHVAALFPGDAIHIGGDEVDKSGWAKCEKCRALAVREGLASTDELQRWVTRRFCAILAAKGRRAVVWDEAVEGEALPENLVVMDWCGKGRGERAAALCRPVVRCVHWSCYFDYAQCLGREPVDYPDGVPPLPLSKVYAYDPLAGLSEADRRFVLGGQCNNWTEWTCTREELEWKLWPRACATAEVFWRAPETRDYAAFARRAEACRATLVREGVNAAPIGAKDGIAIAPRPKKARLTLGTYTAKATAVSEAIARFVVDSSGSAGGVSPGDPLGTRHHGLPCGWRGQGRRAGRPAAAGAPDGARRVGFLGPRTRRRRMMTSRSFGLAVAALCAALCGLRVSAAPAAMMRVWEATEARSLQFEFRFLGPKGRIVVHRACDAHKPRVRIDATATLMPHAFNVNVWNAETGRAEWKGSQLSLGAISEAKALVTNVWHTARVVARTNSLALLVRLADRWHEVGFCEYAWATTAMSIDLTDGLAEVWAVKAVAAGGTGRLVRVEPRGQDVELGFATGYGRALVRLDFADGTDFWMFATPEGESFGCTRKGTGGEEWYGRYCGDSRLSFSGLIGFRKYAPAYVKAYRPSERAAAIDYAAAHPDECAHACRVKMRFAAAGSVWFDGKYMGELTNALARVTLYVPEVAPKGEYLRLAAPPVAAGPQSLALSPEDCTGVRHAADGRAYLDVSTHAEHSDPGQETDHYLARNGFDGLRDSFVWSVPNRCWHRAKVVAAVAPSAGSNLVPVVSVRLSRNSFAGWGNAAALGRLDLAKAPRRAVGATTLGGRRLDLCEYEVDLPVGDIQDRLYVKRGQAWFGGAPYLHAEVLGPLGRPGILWDKSQKPDWRTRSSALVFGLTLLESPCEMELLQSQPGLVFGDDEPRETSVRLRARRAGTYVLRNEIRDWDGAVERTHEQEVALAADEERRVSLDLAVGEGFHALDLSLAEKGCADRPLVTHRATFADVGRDTRVAGHESPYAFWWCGEHHGGRADIDVMGPLFRKLGIRRISAIDGQHTEASMRKYGLTASQIPFNINLAMSVLSKKRTLPEMVKAYEQWLRDYLVRFPSVERRALVFHESYCGGRPNYLWNGPDREWKDIDFAQARPRYEMGVALCRMIREKFPDVKIQLGNSSMSYEILDVMFRLGFPRDLFDILGSETVARFVMPDLPDPSAGPASLAYLNLVADHYGYPQRADVCYEWVCQLAREITPTEAAEWGVRNTLLAFAAGATLAPSAGCTPDDAYYNSDYGSVSTLERYPYLYPTRGAVAKAVMTRELDGATFARFLDTGSQTVNALEFRRANGECVTALWLPRGTARVELLDTGVFGRERALKPRRAVRIDAKRPAALDLSTRPLFVTTDRPATRVRVLSRATPPLVEPRNFQLANALASADEVTLAANPNDRAYAYLRESRYRTNGVYSVSTGDGCLVLTRDRTAVPDLWKTLSEFTYLKLNEPVVLAGEPATLSLEVDGNSSWAEIFFYVEDAEGKLFTPTGIWYEGDGRAHGRVNFDGWGTIQFPFSSKSRVRTSEVDARGGFWRCDARGRKGTEVVYPVKVVGLAVSMPRQTVRGAAFVPVARNPDVLRLRNLGAFE